MASIQDLEIQYRFYSRSEPALDAHLGDILNWYSAIKDDKDAREYMNEYLKEHKRDKDLEVFSRVPDVWMPRTACWMAHLAVRGRPMTPGEKTRFEAYFARALSHADAPKAPDPTKPTVHDYTAAKASEFVAELLGLVDDGVIGLGWSLHTFLKTRQVGGKLAKAIAEKLKTKKDEDKETQKIYTMLVQDASKYALAKNKERKPRKKKVYTPEHITRNLKYLQSSEEYEIESIPATRILGVQELWTFNPKYKVLAVYRAKDRAGLGVDYTKITNYDEATSASKYVGRNTKEIVKEILTSNPNRSKRIFDDVKTKSVNVTRITKDMLLLKVHT